MTLYSINLFHIALISFSPYTYTLYLILQIYRVMSNKLAQIMYISRNHFTIIIPVSKYQIAYLLTNLAVTNLPSVT